MIGWTIEQALTSKYIDEIFVSTDSREIADVAETFGVQVPDLRPEELANDTASSMDFILYTLHLLEKRGKNFFIYSIIGTDLSLKGCYGY